MSVKPKFVCLGVLRHGRLRPYYWFSNHMGDIIRRQSTGLVGIPFLLDLCPDPAHWRALYPKPGTTRGNKIDTLTAAAALAAACEAAGPYWPDDPALLPQNVPKPNPAPSTLRNRASYAKGARRKPTKKRLAFERELASLI